MTAWPLRTGPDGRLETVDGDAAALQHAAVLLATRTGERAVVPSYGTPDLVGHTAADLPIDEVQAAVDQWLGANAAVITRPAGDGTLTLDVELRDRPAG